MFRVHRFNQRKQYTPHCFKTCQQGFTGLELLSVLTLLGILIVLVSPGWFSILARWQLTDAQGDIYSAIRQTQVKARNNSINWQISIRETAMGIVEWSIHPQAGVPQVWQSLAYSSIDIDVANTTLDKRSGSYYIRFGHRGQLASRTRTLTLTSSSNASIKRCIVMSTILGAMRKGEEQQRPSSSGRYCY
ncbi:MAG: hypothetical protein F6K31_43825 [Symploca sp. SIO2G7]|nr:hypothetical protein [Symploca sp. SIO2G7]